MKTLSSAIIPSCWSVIHRNLVVSLKPYWIAFVHTEQTVLILISCSLFVLRQLPILSAMQYFSSWIWDESLKVIVFFCWCNLYSGRRPSTWLPVRPYCCMNGVCACVFPSALTVRIFLYLRYPSCLSVRRRLVSVSASRPLRAYQTPPLRRLEKHCFWC